MTNEKLFKTMVAAIEEANEKELQYLIAKRDKDEAIAAYRDCGVCQNLTDDKRGQGGKTAEIYCGTEENAEFLIDALGQLGIKAECEIFTTDGEFMLEVRL